MRKALRTLLALAAAAFLLWQLPRLLVRQVENAPASPAALRVWCAAREAPLSRWLRRQAAAYEKATGQRVYLRSAREEEAAAARQNPADPLSPDVIVSPGEGIAVAYQGWALILRDPAAALVTPSPTGALFSRPAPLQAATPTPPPGPSDEDLAAVLAPKEMLGALPNTLFSAQPARDLADGRGTAALLTAGEAAPLGAGYRALSLENRKGLLPFGADDLTKAGDAFIAFLLSPAAQQSLSSFGLYSPVLRLYDAQTDPLRALIESGFDSTRNQ